jgi:alanyl-tRNA synthetase
MGASFVAQEKQESRNGSRDKEAARLVFARSDDASGDMNALIREAFAMLDGRGGGKPDLAQGGGKDFERLGEALELAKNSVSSLRPNSE